MAYHLSDIYIGDYPLTQNYGARQEIYAARYGIRGHNGIDIACPTMTPILSAADGEILEINFDPGGYGKYVKILHAGFLTLYAHLNDVIVQEKDRVVCGQLIGHSNNTGYSEAPHLHFGVAPCDVNGVKSESNNGYSGYIDPMGDRCEWVIKNLKEPVVPTLETKPPIPVRPDDFTNMVSEGSNYKVIATFAINQGLNAFLTSESQVPIDINKRPADPKGGEKVVMYFAALLDEARRLKASQSPLPVEAIPQEKKDSFIKQLLISLKVIQP